MWKTVGLCLLVFLVTVAETLVSTWEGRADRQATSCRDNRFSKKAANWAGVFELLLVIDIVATVSNPLVLMPIVFIAARQSKYWSVERRRKKWRARVRKPRRKEVA